MTTMPQPSMPRCKFCLGYDCEHLVRPLSSSSWNREDENLMEMLGVQGTMVKPGYVFVEAAKYIEPSYQARAWGHGPHINFGAPCPGCMQ